MSDQIQGLIAQFTQKLKVTNRAVQTIESYSLHIRLFFAALKITNIKKATKEKIESYIFSLYAYRNPQDQPYALSTISLKIRSVRRFFEYLESEGLLLINPTEFIAEPKHPGTLPKDILTAKEVKKIFTLPDVNTPIGLRDRTILEILYSTGIRINELCTLTIYDIDLNNKVVKIRLGKGGKDRVLPIGLHAVSFIKSYITKSRSKLTITNRTEKTLFISRYGDPLSSQSVAIMIKKYSSRVLTKQVTAHTFRHTFATQLIRNEANIRDVQEMLGHSTLKITQKYLRVTGVSLKKAHKRTHPSEKTKMSLQEVPSPTITRKRPHYGHSRAY